MHLFERQTYAFHPLVQPPICPQQPELSQAEARTPEFIPGFPQGTGTQELEPSSAASPGVHYWVAGLKQRSWDSIHTLTWMQVSQVLTFVPNTLLSVYILLILIVGFYLVLLQILRILQVFVILITYKSIVIL